MPKNTKVYRCVQEMDPNIPKGSRIAICQKSTGQSYRSGKKI